MAMPDNESITDETLNDFGAGKEIALRVLMQMKRDYGLSGEDMRDPARMQSKVEVNGGRAMNDGLLNALIMMDNAMFKVMPELFRNYNLTAKDMSSAARLQARIEADAGKAMSDGLRNALNLMNKAAAQILVNLPAHYGLTAWDMQDPERTRAKAHANGGKDDMLRALLWFQRHHDKFRR